MPEDDFLVSNPDAHVLVDDAGNTYIYAPNLEEWINQIYLQMIHVLRASPEAEMLGKKPDA